MNNMPNKLTIKVFTPCITKNVYLTLRVLYYKSADDQSNLKILFCIIKRNVYICLFCLLFSSQCVRPLLSLSPCLFPSQVPPTPPSPSLVTTSQSILFSCQVVAPQSRCQRASPWMRRSTTLKMLSLLWI